MHCPCQSSAPCIRPLHSFRRAFLLLLKYERNLQRSALWQPAEAVLPWSVMLPAPSESGKLPTAAGRRTVEGNLLKPSSSASADPNCTLFREQLQAIISEAGATEQQKAEAQRLLADQHDEISRYADAVQMELESKAKIEEQLRKMESRVLHGGENLVDKMSELKKLAKETKAELDVKRYDTPCLFLVGKMLASKLDVEHRDVRRSDRRQDPKCSSVLGMVARIVDSSNVEY
jgi:hypothetical protein